METLLSKLKKGGIGKVSQFTNELTAGRLTTMGILPGSRIKMVRIAPFNGGFYLKVDGANMVMRLQEADSIMVEEVGN